ncbi:hypothetical protein LBMAG42_46390 [Deltaproteobacteria bacterium]|nr:hypothetical protein LBMAG42_46390 [Deltaproteobacteria bacterium]
MILAPIALALVGLAFADPIALRAPSGDVAVVVGVPDSSAGFSITPHFGVSVDVHPFDAVGASIGYRHDVFRRETGFGLEVAVAGGPTVPLLDPGLAVSATPSLSLGWARGPVDATIGVAVPAVAGLTGFSLRFPVLGEVWLGGKIGPARVGGTFGAGQMWILGAPTELGWHGGLYVAVALRRPTPAANW